MGRTWDRFDDTPVTCLGWLWVDGGAGSVTEISVLSNDVVESDGRPSFPRALLVPGSRTELGSASRLKLEYVRSTEPSGEGCGLRLTC